MAGISRLPKADPEDCGMLDDDVGIQQPMTHRQTQRAAEGALRSGSVSSLKLSTTCCAEPYRYPSPRSA